jgi:hypothetical protein
MSSKAIVAGSGDYTTAFNAIAAYKITVTSVSASSTYTSTSVTSGACTITGIVAANDYRVTVMGYSDAAATKQVALGTASSVAITTGSTANVSVTLSFTQSAAAGASNAGGFLLPIQWPVSTGLAYIHVTLDGTALADPSVTTGTTYYTATLSASSLKGGVHTLDIYFKTSSSATVVVGPYIESVNIWDGVTDSMWADTNGSLNATLTIAASEFSSADASLSSLTLSSATLSPTFSAGTTSGYSVTGLSGSSFSFVATAVSGSQNVTYTWNGTAGSWASINGSTFTSSSLTPVSMAGLNTLTITVTAPDRQTTQTYAFNPLIASGIYTSASFNSLISTSGSTVIAGAVTITDSWGTAISPFSGFLEGGGHTITLSSGATTGLFGSVTGTIQDLNVSVTTLTCGQADCGILANTCSGGTINNCSTSGTVAASGHDYVGGLVGWNGYPSGGGTIENSSSNATITNGGDYIGGLVGENYFNGTITKCHATGTVSGNNIVGGLVGDAKNTSPVSYSYASGNVRASNGDVGGLMGYTNGNVTSCYAVGAVQCTTGSNCGGLFGNVVADGGETDATIYITNCYARGAVTSTSASDTGGFVGSTSANTHTIKYEYCYSTGVVASGGSYVGEFVALDSGGSYTDCYQSASTSETTSPNVYNSLQGTLPSSGFTTTWGIDTSGTINNGYPYLQYFGSNTVTP